MESKKLHTVLLALTALTGLSLAACDETSDPVDSGMTMEDSATPPSNTIVDIAVANPDFSMLVSAASRAGLVDLLGAPGSYTVFAPTNEAFMASGITQDAIDTMPVASLTGILTYHALAGAVESGDVTDGPVSTLADLTFFLGTTGGVTINGGNATAGAPTSSPPTSSPTTA